MKSMAWCLCCKLICYLSVVYGKVDGDGGSCMQGWMGMGTTLKLVAGIAVGMGIVPGTVGDGYKYVPLQLSSRVTYWSVACIIIPGNVVCSIGSLCF